MTTLILSEKKISALASEIQCQTRSLLLDNFKNIEPQQYSIKVVNLVTDGNQINFYLDDEIFKKFIKVHKYKIIEETDSYFLAVRGKMSGVDDYSIHSMNKLIFRKRQKHLDVFFYDVEVGYEIRSGHCK